MIARDDFFVDAGVCPSCGVNPCPDGAVCHCCAAVVHDPNARLRAQFPDYIELGIPLDFSAEGYKARLARIRKLGDEGKGPMAELRKFCRGNG